MLAPHRRDGDKPTSGGKGADGAGACGLQCGQCRPAAGGEMTRVDVEGVQGMGLSEIHRDVGQEAPGKRSHGEQGERSSVPEGSWGGWSPRKWELDRSMHWSFLGTPSDCAPSAHWPGLQPAWAPPMRTSLLDFDSEQSQVPGGRCLARGHQRDHVSFPEATGTVAPGPRGVDRGLCAVVLRAPLDRPGPDVGPVLGRASEPGSPPCWELRTP